MMNAHKYLDFILLINYTTILNLDFAGKNNS